MPSVSVIIPNYNHEQYLAKRIESVLGQTFGDFEIIILDDCSDDNSMNIINNYKNHPKVSNVIINEKNYGNTFRQWEKGIKASAGKYIWLAESDDYAAGTFLEILVNELENNDSGIAYCQSVFIDKNNNIIFDPPVNTENLRLTGEKFVVEKMVYGNSIFNSSAVLFKRELISELSAPVMKYCGDWLFWVKILKNTNIAVIKEKLNFFRRHEESVSSWSDKKGLQFIEGFVVLRYIRANYFIDKNEWKKILYKYSYRWALFIISNEYRKIINFRIFLISLTLDLRISFFTLKYLFYYLKNKSL